MGKWRDPIRRRFIEHRFSTRQRGIEFDFTLEEWVNWWETNLGPRWFTLRGNAPDQYCMARKKDEGPYCGENVYLATNAENRRDRTINGITNFGEKNPQSKLAETQVIEILESSLSQRTLARKYGVNQSAISLIRSGKRWGHITKEISK